MFNYEFIHPDQNFKLLFGMTSCHPANATLATGVDTSQLTDGVWLALQNDGTWKIANGDANAYPVLEMKFQYDNRAVNAVTVAMGAGWYAVTKKFQYDAGSPAIGDKLKTANGILKPVAGDGSEDDLAVAVIEQVIGSGDRILIKRLA